MPAQLSAVRYLIEREYLPPLFLLIVARGQPAKFVFFEVYFVSCISITRYIACKITYLDFSTEISVQRFPEWFRVLKVVKKMTVCMLLVLCGQKARAKRTFTDFVKGFTKQMY